MSFLDRFRRPKAAPRDYLYLDRPRLNSYLEQVSSTRAEDKSRSIRVAIAVTGPSASAEQGTSYREKTDHEKVGELIGYLDRYGHLSRQRPAMLHNDREIFEEPDFVLEECDAVRVLIPLTGATESGKGIVVWVCGRSIAKVMLFALQGRCASFRIRL